MGAYLRAHKLALFLFIVAAGMMLYAHIEASAVPAHYQRAFLPSAKTSDALAPDNGLYGARMAARDMDKRLADVCGATALYAVREDSAVTSVSTADERSANARLIAMDTSYYAIRQPMLYCGRLLYPDELEAGERVVMLDEQLAVALFQYAEPLGQKLVLDGEEYDIVGILRAGRKVGMRTDYKLYAPYRALERGASPFTELVYEAVSLPGSGGWVGFQNAVVGMGETGTTISLAKERVGAGMPERVFLCALGFTACVFVLRKLTFHVKQFAKRYQQKLRDIYAIRLLPWLAACSLGFLLGYAACLAGLAMLFVTMIEPVYSFPEWIPAILVEPNDIQTAFWNVWHAAADVVEVRTEEIVRLRFLREVAGWGAGVGMFACFLGVRKG